MYMICNYFDFKNLVSSFVLFPITIKLDLEFC